MSNTVLPIIFLVFLFAIVVTIIIKISSDPDAKDLMLDWDNFEDIRDSHKPS